MYPDEETAYAYCVLWEYIDAEAVSKEDALQALLVLSERIRELNANEPD